jgi:hypothetical protein
MANLKQTKECKECNKVLALSQFSKRSASPDGLQPKCKQCNSKDNLKFRTDKPEHHEQWQKNNSEQHVRNVTRYRKADKASKIYSISNENGEHYIGMTNTHISVRMFEHKTHYRRRHGDIPGLHESFDKFGFDNHKVDVLLELEGIDRTQLRFIEKAFIQSFYQQGKSLNKLI